MENKVSFKEFLGKCALNGKQIAVYENGDEITVKAETVGGKGVRYIYHDDKGEKKWAALKPMVLTREDYESFKEFVSDGFAGSQNAVIVQRVLEEMGYPAFEK